MRVALPLFGRDVAPRFCFAREMLVVDIVDGKENERKYVMFSSEQGPLRIKKLREYGVEVILCSGFNRYLLPVANESGIQVVWGLMGDADQVLEKYRTGDLESWRGPQSPDACRRRQRRRNKARGGR